MARPEYVRVRIKETGAHKSIPRATFERSPELYSELKQPATLSDGRPLPDKHKTSVAAAASEKKASQTAATTTEKES